LAQCRRPQHPERDSFKTCKVISRSCCTRTCRSCGIPNTQNFSKKNWLFEAITETYLPLLEVFDGWMRDGMDTRLAICLSPTLCAMLRDPLLQERLRAPPGCV